MKKFYFLLVAMLCSVAAQAWTVHFTNPNGWPEVAVWAWDNSANYTGGEWPGKLMTKDGDVWTYTGEGNPAFVIFNNNNKGIQTATFDFVEGATYDMEGVVGAVAQELTVYFDNNDNWEDVYVYSWSPNTFGTHPGTKLTEKNADGLYVVTVTSKTENPFDGFQFNNGKGGADERKTPDLKWETGATYNAAGKVGDQPDPVDPEPMENWYVSVDGYFYNAGESWKNGEGKKPVDGMVEFTDCVLGTYEFEINIWDGVNNHYYGTSEPVVAGTDKWVQLYENGGHMTVANGAAGEGYTVKFDCNNNQINLSPVDAGIEGVAADAAQAPAAYYNLQGIRVANPEAGVFIMVQGGKAVKVIK